MPAGVCLLLALAGSAVAQPVYEDRVEPYVVKSGDTISHITHRLLGDSTFWEDNWKLNPQVRDPDKLRIGQVLQIIVERKVIAQSARVVQAVNQTEKMLQKPRWEHAAVGDELGSGQGLRTRENSTAELRFNAESSLKLSEFSQVFLASKNTSLRGVDRGQATVERGAVDLVFEPLAKPKTRIELIAGSASARPTVAPGKRAEIRAGATDDGGAKVMVFRGDSAVTAGGAEVAVAEGMGTRVPEKGPPAPPEKLLPAPTILDASLRWNYSNGLLQWSAVDGAAGYRIEICADDQCQAPRETATLPGNALLHQVRPLPEGDSFWRVLALSASELDGYPSAVGHILVDDATPDLEGPMLTLVPASGFVVGADGAVRLGPNAQLRLDAFDEASGVALIETGDGASWQPVDVGTLLSLGALPEGRRLRASDVLGNSTELIVSQMPAPNAP